MVKKQLLLEVEDHPDDTAAGLCCFSALLRYQHNDPTIAVYSTTEAQEKTIPDDSILPHHTLSLRHMQRGGGWKRLARGNLRRSSTCKKRLLKELVRFLGEGRSPGDAL